MTERTLRLVVRTPRGAAFDEGLVSLRVPGSTGQIGLRPRAEPAAFVVEPGLVLATGARGRRFLATAGGLLRTDGREAVLLTPVAVVGASPESVRQELEAKLGASSAAFELRSVLQRLETGILQELRRSASDLAGGGPHG